jgi:hypothetical protein
MHEMGTGQQVAQLHERLMMIIIIITSFLSQPPKSYIFLATGRYRSGSLSQEATWELDRTVRCFLARE